MDWTFDIELKIHIGPTVATRHPDHRGVLRAMRIRRKSALPVEFFGAQFRGEVIGTERKSLN